MDKTLAGNKLGARRLSQYSVATAGAEQYATRIAIIGLGSRGLTILERIIAHARLFPSHKVELFLFEPQRIGVGCHPPTQHPTFLLNTITSQLTQFSDDSTMSAGPILSGPSFYHWLSDRRTTNQNIPSILTDRTDPDAYCSRALFGHYLTFVFDYLTELAPDHVRITPFPVAAEDARRSSDGTWTISGGDVNVDKIDFVYLTTGHTKSKTPADTERHPRPSVPVITDPYPIEKTLAGVTSDHVVAVEGMGLTSFDIISYLTLGRGGTFYRSSPEGELQYRPSGTEPKILAFSRSGLPLSARAVNQKGTSGRYRARHLTLEHVKSLRSLEKIDFQKSILPLLLLDMEHAYYTAYLKKTRSLTETMLFMNHLVFAREGERERLIRDAVPEQDQFSWEKFVSPISLKDFDNQQEYGTWLQNYLRSDIINATEGNVDNPIKAACDVLRDLRDSICAAIDFGGLTEASHRWFYSEFAPVMNRIAIGPPLERIEQFLALMKAGILTADLGPGTRCVPDETSDGWRVMSGCWPDYSLAADLVVKARVSMHSPKDDQSPLIRKLLADGHARLFYNGKFHPGGLDVNRDLNLIGSDGSVHDNVWALGMLTEGPKFYTFAIPRPGVNSTAIGDAGRAVGQMFASMQGNVSEALSA
jgi:uncharacterized NAD(P)/FAD-binding protein YdhS